MRKKDSIRFMGRAYLEDPQPANYDFSHPQLQAYFEGLEWARKKGKLTPFLEGKEIEMVAEDLPKGLVSRIMDFFK